MIEGNSTHFLNEERGAVAEDEVYCKFASGNVRGKTKGFSGVEKVEQIIQVMDENNHHLDKRKAGYNQDIESTAADTQTNENSDIYDRASSILEINDNREEGVHLLTSTSSETVQYNELSNRHENDYTADPSILSSGLNVIGTISTRLNIGLYLQNILGITNQILASQNIGTDINQRRANVHFTSNRPYSRLIHAQRQLAFRQEPSELENNTQRDGDHFTQGGDLSEDENGQAASDETQARGILQNGTWSSPQIGNESNASRNAGNILTADMARIRQRRRSAFDPFASYFFVVYHFSIVLILAVMLLILIYNFLHSTPISFR